MPQAALLNRLETPPPRLIHATERKFLHAWHAREYSAEAPEGIGVWKYAFPLGAHQPIEDVHVRFGDADWVGSFECAHGRNLDVIPWPAADAIVVCAANALYIVDPKVPQQFSGFAAPVEIDGVTFDESGEHMFVAESLRVHAFSKDRCLLWISEPLDGYGARFRGCAGRVVAVEVKQQEPDPDTEEAHSALIRLRAEDGTILRSRFRLALHYGLKRSAA